MEFKLFMLLLGCRPEGRNTEQHYVFFGIAKELRDLVPDIRKFWKGSGNIHLDGWRIVQNVDGYQIAVSEKSENTKEKHLFFLNLGGYKENQFEEFHYKMLCVAQNNLAAASVAKQTAFYMHTGFGKDAASHIDDRFGVDVDDIFEIKDILPEGMKNKFSISIADKVSEQELPPDKINLGFFKLDQL